MNARWRGTVLSAVCIGCGFIVFYGWYARGVTAVKPLLWIFAVGAFLGGLLSFIDSLKQMTGKAERGKSFENRAKEK